MKEKVRKFSKLAYWLILGMILMYIVGMQFYAQEITDFIGYRFYAVMTDSMEPRIPTYSMVLTKTIDENESIAPGEIITFKVQRGEQEIVLTHHFNKTQEENGQLYYRTNAEGRDELDLYYTKRSDIIGKYVWHIPLLGKFMSELYSLLIAVVLSASIASLFIEIPVSHLSVLHHLKLACKYYFTLPNQYYYYRDKNKEENINKEEENSDFYQEERYTASKKTKKADKRNHR